MYLKQANVSFLFSRGIFGGGGGINLHIFQTLMPLIVYHTKTPYSKENIIVYFFSNAVQR